MFLFKYLQQVDTESLSKHFPGSLENTLQFILKEKKPKQPPYKLLKIKHLLFHKNICLKQYYCKNDVTHLANNH